MYIVEKVKKKKGSEWLPYVNYLHTAQDDEIFYQLKYMTGDYVLKKNKLSTIKFKAPVLSLKTILIFHL